MTVKQSKLFFSLCKQANLNLIYAKERAKEKFHTKSFNDLSNDQLDELIKLLEETITASNPTPPQQKGFPNNFRIWDKEKEHMYYDLDAIVVADFQPDKLDENLHVMQFTGRKDSKGVKIYDQDFILSAVGKKYLIQWSWNDCAWVAVENGTTQNMYLSSFSNPVKVGSIYEK
jgi:YopX protein